MASLPYEYAYEFLFFLCLRIFYHKSKNTIIFVKENINVSYKDIHQLYAKFTSQGKGLSPV